MPVFSSCRCGMFVSCVHPVAVLNAAFCITCMHLVNAGQGCKRQPHGRGKLQSRSHDCLIGSLLFTLSCCCECFIMCSGLSVCTEML